MKNLHLIPTSQPSRLIYNDANQLCYQSNKSFKNDRKSMYRKKFNIYITSDEEIKVGDWFIYRGYEVCKCTGLSQSKQILTDNQIARHKDYGKPQSLSKKIIITTDLDLIKDGVQAIDDEFLEWFVKNPSCENVEVKKVILGKVEGTSMVIDKYKIIIPKEEPKQERMYSEEDMIEFAVWLYLEVGSNKGKERTNKELFNKWFEQFKKK